MSVAPALPISPGLPVEIGQIEKALGRLWEDSGDTKTRASLINLAIYTESSDAVQTNTEIVSQIAGQHACRALLILANREAPTSAARAWISAHCHTEGKGTRQICSEQITFQLDGNLSSALPNVVFSHLDSDLPLCVWWQAPFHEPIDTKLWSWVDRLIYDSQKWADPLTQIRLARQIGNLGDARTILCDLNWARLVSSRFALANLFDHASALPCLRRIDDVEIAHAPHARTTALLLLGWLAAQLGWTLDSVLSRHAFRDTARHEINFRLVETPGACVSAVRLRAGDAEFALTRDQDAEFFHGSMRGGGVTETTQLFPAGRDRLTDVLLMELSRGGVHPLYHKALAAVEPLLEA